MVAPQAKILVVDDEVKNVKLLEALLLPRGYEVVTAFNGEEALRQVQQERPDLILLDIMMPVMDGFEVCKILKDNADTRLIPVVIMTGWGRGKTASGASKPGPTTSSPSQYTVTNC